MESQSLEQLINESIQLELNVATLYGVFSDQHREDRDFWWDLHLEEKGHAGILRAAKDYLAHHDVFLKSLIAQSLKELTEANSRITEEIQNCRNHSFSRVEACELAIRLENEVGESHYALFMNKEAKNAIESAFQKLNREDKNHEQRIKEYLAGITAEK